jgi:DNA-binding IclR family transcriptional regulator
MNTDTTRKILKSLRAWQVLDRGVGLTLSEVAKWSGIPRMTTYRYLRKMVGCGMVRGKVGMYRNQDATFYTIARGGEKFLDDIFPF